MQTYTAALTDTAAAPLAGAPERKYRTGEAESAAHRYAAAFGVYGFSSSRDLGDGRALFTISPVVGSPMHILVTPVADEPAPVAEASPVSEGWNPAREVADYVDSAAHTFAEGDLVAEGVVVETLPVPGGQTWARILGDDGFEVCRNVRDLVLVEEAVTPHEVAFAMLDEATGYALDEVAVYALAEEAVENLEARFAAYDARTAGAGK